MGAKGGACLDGVATETREGCEMSLSDAAWIFTGVVFAVIVGCVVWTIKEERRK